MKGRLVEGHSAECSPQPNRDIHHIAASHFFINVSYRYSHVQFSDEFMTEWKVGPATEEVRFV